MEPFPAGFFDRIDPSSDAGFYAAPRLVAHIDAGAIEAVGALYEELAVDGEVLDLMGSWVSHFRARPRELTVLGMNAAELAANEQASATVARDLNADPVLPFAEASFDHAVCCVSVDYLVRPLEVFAEVARVLRPGGRFVVTFSDRCFATKAIRGWLETDDAGHVAYVRRLFELTDGFGAPVDERRRGGRWGGDPLWAVWAPVSACATRPQAPLRLSPPRQAPPGPRPAR